VASTIGGRWQRGLLLPATLAGRLGLEALGDEVVDLGTRRRAAGAQVMTWCTRSFSAPTRSMMRAPARGEARRCSAPRDGPPPSAPSCAASPSARAPARSALGARAHPRLGPGPGRLGADGDGPRSTIARSTATRKQGAASSHRVRGYHRCLPPRKDGEVLHIRMRRGRPTRCAGRALRQGACWPGAPGGRVGPAQIAPTRVLAKRVIEALQPTRSASRSAVRTGMRASPGDREIPTRTGRRSTTPPRRGRGGRDALHGLRLVVRRTRLVGPKQSSSPTGPPRLPHRPRGERDHARRRPSPARRLRAFDPRSEAEGSRTASGRFFANAAWAVIAALAHNLVRWVSAIGLGSSGQWWRDGSAAATCAFPAGSPASAGGAGCTCPSWPWPRVPRRARSGCGR